MLNCSQAQKQPIYLSLLHRWMVLPPCTNQKNACLYSLFLSLRIACRELVVMLKRDFTTPGWLVLFSLEVTIIKWFHLIVFATVFLPLSLSYAWRNNLQHKEKNAGVTLITFFLDNKWTYIAYVSIELLDWKFRIRVYCKFSFFMP